MKTPMIVVLLFFILAACGPVPTEQPVTPTATSAPTFTPLVSPFAIITPIVETPAAFPIFTFTPPVFPSQAPTVTPLVNKQVVNAWQTQIALETPIRTPATPIWNAKLPKVYISDGNLYFQSSTSQSVQLTKNGKDRNPILSDDGKKIAFYRGEAADNLYSINSDGSQEQVIITSEIPLLIGKGQLQSPVFVPGTHLLLFNTYLCGTKKGLYDYADCTIGIYSVDTDTGKINIVVENISGNSMRNSNFDISPDGKYVSVAGAGHINIYKLSSGRFEIAYPNVITYFVTPPDEYLPKQYWLTNSSGLIIIRAADHESNEPTTPPWSYVAFRYTIGDSQAAQIPLDKFIIWEVQRDDWSISPDRKWILFAGNETGDLRDGGLYYLGNLTDGSTQAYSEIEWPLSWYKWSPDSRHFAHTNAIGFIGSIDGSPVPVGGHFSEWIDATHYYYQVIDNTTGTTQTYIGKIDSK